MSKTLAMFQSAGRSMTSYRVFLSSGHTPELRMLRDRVEALCRVMSELLMHHRLPARLDIARWEHTPPQLVEGDRLNPQFVEQALASDLVVVLLGTELRPGTREELEAVLLEHGRIAVAVFCFGPRDCRSTELQEFLDARENIFFYKEVESVDGDDAWYELVRSVVSFMVSVVRRHDQVEAQHDRY